MICLGRDVWCWCPCIFSWLTWRWLGSASVQRELQRLNEAGLISSQRVGNLRRFQANHDHPVYAELHGLIQKSFGLLGVLQTAIAPLLPLLRCAFV